MKILTLNTWQELGPVPWQERWEVILEGIRQHKPQIVGFQEFFNQSWAAEVRNRTGFPTMLSDPKRAAQVVYSEYPVSSWGVVTLTQSPLEEYLRYLLWSEMEIGGKKLFFFNTHFSWKLEDGETRRKQAAEVVSFINEKAGSQESLLIGDFNAPRHSPEIRWLIEEGRFRDLFIEKRPAESGFTWDSRNPYCLESSQKHHLPDRRIDFILARGEGPLLKNLVSCDLVFTRPNEKGVWASDHLGVLTEFKI